MSKVIDIEAKIPLACVQLDGLVVSKIVKHASSASSFALGYLIGIDLDGVLEISNSFGLPNVSDDDESSSKTIASYQKGMLNALKEVEPGDGVIVGFYQSNTLGAFFKQSLLDLQSIHRERLRHGGVVVVHDITQASRGNAAFRAFRLTKQFYAEYKSGKFTTQSLFSHQLTFSAILEEIPLRIRTNPLLGGFLSTLTTPRASSTPSSSQVVPSVALSPNFSSLDLAPQHMASNLANVLDALDEYKAEEGSLAYQMRNIVRDRNRANEHLQRRKEENALRVSQGLAPLPEEDIARMFKIPPEPSRLKSLLLLGQIDAYSQSLGGAASEGYVKMYSANAGSASA